MLYTRCHCIGLRECCDWCVALAVLARRRGGQWAEERALADPTQLEQILLPSRELDAEASKRVADLMEHASQRGRALVEDYAVRGFYDRWTQLETKLGAKSLPDRKGWLAWVVRRRREEAARLTQVIPAQRRGAKVPPAPATARSKTKRNED